VSNAIKNTGYRGEVSCEYIDGGVLNNKPFEPLLKVMFERVPDGKVERRLFYVEPDPEEFYSNSMQSSPLAVAMAALTGLPSHQSIGESLDELRQQNERIRWFCNLRQKMPHPNQLSTRSEYALKRYWAIRSESIAKSLFLDEEEAPWAGSTIPVEKKGEYEH